MGIAKNKERQKIIKNINFQVTESQLHLF